MLPNSLAFYSEAEPQDLRYQAETGFLYQIGREDARIIAETRFLGLWIAWELETGFLPKISVKMPK